MVTNRFLFLIYGLASTFAFVERNLVSLRPTDIYSTTPDISKFSGGTRIHSSRRDKQRQENWKPYNNTISINNACNMIQRLGSNKKIDAWMDLLANEGKFSNPPIFAFWSVQEQITFIKLLKQYRAYKSISIFLDNLGKQNVKVCTTAIFSLALSPNCRDQAIDILDRMDEAGTEPTALTFIALLGSVDGPSATVEMMKRIESYKNVKVNVEVFNSAIYACCRTHLGSRPDDNDWKTALDLLQQMRRKRINPTTKTYHAILQVLSRTGKVKMAFSLLEQLNNTKNLQPDDRVWMAALRVCAQAGDCGAAIQVVNEMQEAGCRPNLRHCSALLKTFSQAGQDQLAYAALGMMLGEDIQTTSKTSAFSLPLTAPDLVALNTVIAACSKGGNFEGAKSIFERMKTGEFSDPISHQVISPDRITYHSILVGCRDSETATSIVKEVNVGVSLS